MSKKTNKKSAFTWRLLFGTAMLSATSACGTVGVQQARTMDVQKTNSDANEVSSFFTGWSMKSATGPDLDLGETIKGDVILISFFATYCTRCKQKLFDHQLLHEKYAAQGLSVLGVSVDEPETQSEVTSFVRSRDLTFPVVIDTESRLVSQFNPRKTLPFSVLIDASGRVLWSHVGYAPGDGKTTEGRVLEALQLPEVKEN